MFALPFLMKGQAAPALSLKTRIPLANVKGRMDHLSVDLQGHRLFATAFENHTLEVIDVQGGKQIHTIRDLEEPQGAFFDASNNLLFVSSEGDGAVKVFDGKTFDLLHTVKLSADADNVRYDAGRKRVLVGYGGEKFLRGKPARGQGDGALAFVDAMGKKTGEIAVDAHPESFQLEKSGNRVFINVPDHMEIQVADLAKGTLITHWAVTTCTDNFPMTLDEPHHRLFVGCREPAKLLVFDTESGRQVASLDSLSSDDIFYDASKGRIYVLGTSGQVDVFQQKDADHYEKLASYPTSPGSGTGFFVPEWNELFVSAPAQDNQSAAILVYETR
jgi:DNA-binding beta-propeller fold protein YncE